METPAHHSLQFSSPSYFVFSMLCFMAGDWKVNMDLIYMMNLLFLMKSHCGRKNRLLIRKENLIPSLSLSSESYFHFRVLKCVDKMYKSDSTKRAHSTLPSNTCEVWVCMMLIKDMESGTEVKRTLAAFPSSELVTNVFLSFCIISGSRVSTEVTRLHERSEIGKDCK